MDSAPQFDSSFAQVPGPLPRHPGRRARLSARVAGLLLGSLLPGLFALPVCAQRGRQQRLQEGLQPLPNVVRWTDAGHFILSKFEPGSPPTFTEMDAATGAVKAAGDGGRFDTQPKRLQVRENDLYLVGNGASEQLTRSPELEKTVPALSPDGSHVAFVRKHDLYVLDIKTGAEKRLTQDGAPDILNGYSSWVYNEEILGRATSYRAFWWSPDGSHIAFFRTDESMVPEFTYTDDSDGEDHGVVKKQRYPQPGDLNPQVRVGIVAVLDGSVHWSDIDDKTDHYIGTPYWQPDSKALLTQWVDRPQQDYRLLSVDPATGHSEAIYEEKQPTWIDLEDEERLTFIGSAGDFLFISDKSGYRQIYHYDAASKQMSRVTGGDFVVRHIVYADTQNKVVYFTGNGESLVDDDLYRVGLDGKEQKRLSFGPYTHQISASPDGHYFVTRYSNAGTPDRLALIDNQGKLIRELGDSRAPNYDPAKFASVSEIIMVKSADGKFDLPVRITRPAKLKPGQKYPLAVSIYGGPAASEVNNRFNGSSPNAEAGPVIHVSMDHRGSYEFGKVGQNYMYRQLGRWEVEDWSQIVRWLIANEQVDPAKVEISGYSYGGYATCFAMEHAPDIFKFGIAGGTVTDWKFYDTAYAERYMGTPQNNPDGYKTSSVLAGADLLKGRLMLTHGVSDDNVHLINDLAFISKLEEENKNFEMMLYPGSGHGVSGPKQRQYNQAITQFMRQNLFGSASDIKVP